MAPIFGLKAKRCNLPPLIPGDGPPRPNREPRSCPLPATTWWIAVAKFSGFDTMEKAAPHIARLSIEGIITGDEDTIQLIKDIGDSKASAVLLKIDSPGGTTAGAEKLY